MKHITRLCRLIGLFWLPLAALAATAARAGDVIDLVGNLSAGTGDVVLPALLDGTLVNPPESEKLGEHGRVRLTFTVNTDGTVSDIKITGPSKYWRLNDAAVASILSRAYTPATRGGTPVAVRIGAISSFRPDASDNGFDDLNEAQDLNLSCRYGTHRVAVDACTKLMDSGKLAPGNGLYPRANAYQQLGDYSRAAADYSRLIGPDVTKADLYRNRGFAYEGYGQYDKAVEDYAHAIQIDPNVAGTWWDRGFAYDRLGQHDRALADFDAAMKHRPRCDVVGIRGIGPDFAPPPGSLDENPHGPTIVQSPFHPVQDTGPGSGGRTGQASYARNQDPTEGKVSVVTAATCRPSWVSPLEDIADIKRGQPDEVQRLEYRCWARAAWDKDLDAALDDCNRALELYPLFIRAYATRGWVHFRKGDYAAAQRDTSAAIARNPRLASALYIRGLARLKTGDTPGAQADIFAARAADLEIAATYARYNIRP